VVREVISRTRVEKSSYSTLLPAGSSSSNYSLECFLWVYDTLHAQSEKSISVQVISRVFPISDVLNFMSTNLENIQSDPRSLQFNINFDFEHSLLNADCSGAPRCVILNRYNRSTTTGTCERMSSRLCW